MVKKKGFIIIAIFNIILCNAVVSMQKDNHECLILNMPNEILLNFIESVIKLDIDNWINIFKFNKNLLISDLTNLFLTCKKFNNFNPKYNNYVINIIKRLKEQRLPWLKNQIRAQYASLYHASLYPKQLDLKLLDIISKYDVAENNLQEAFKLIISGANVNLRDGNGRNILMRAAIFGHEGMLKLFLSEAKVNLNLQDKFGYNALMLATLNGHCGAVKLFINNNVTLDAKSKNGNTALILAVITRYKDIVELLLNNGANADIKNNNEDTALDIALKYKYDDMAELLKKTDINLQDHCLAS